MLHCRTLFWPLCLTLITAALSAAGNDTTALANETQADAYLGRWCLDFPDGYGGWLEVSESGDGLEAQLLWRVGSPRDVEAALEQERLVLKRKRRNKPERYVADVHDGVIRVRRQDGKDNPAAESIASGKRCPPMPPKPDLSQVTFGDPIRLFNGENLDGWQLQPPNARNGWSVIDGELVNETPKTDFGAYGDYGNLRTEQEFGDFQLHIEFNVESDRNSGVYLRGLYEAQVVDRDSPMQGINGPGAIFGRIAPSHNAGKPGGQWQTYDLTLLDRHITVVLNGEKVIDNQPVLGCTGGALFGDVTRKGPIYLQGDHTSVRYRNIVLRPRVD